MNGINGHCYFHHWRQLSVRVSGPNWTWRYRCMRCATLQVFVTPYPPETPRLGEPDHEPREPRRVTLAHV